MSKTSDLCGLGFSWPQAQAEGYSQIAITAAGSSTTDATVCDTQNSIFTMTATGADGIRLSASTPLMKPIIVSNISSSTGKVYPPTSGTFNGLSADTAISVGANKAIICMRYSSTGWLSNLSA